MASRRLIALWAVFALLFSYSITANAENAKNKPDDAVELTDNSHAMRKSPELRQGRSDFAVTAHNIKKDGKLRDAQGHVVGHYDSGLISFEGDSLSSIVKGQ